METVKGLARGFEDLKQVWGLVPPSMILLPELHHRLLHACTWEEGRSHWQPAPCTKAPSERGSGGPAGADQRLWEVPGARAHPLACTTALAKCPPSWASVSSLSKWANGAYPAGSFSQKLQRAWQARPLGKWWSPVLLSFPQLFKPLVSLHTTLSASLGSGRVFREIERRSTWGSNDPPETHSGEEKGIPGQPPSESVSGPDGDRLEKRNKSLRAS